MGAKPALLRMLLAGRDEGCALEEALDGLACIFSRPGNGGAGRPLLHVMRRTSSLMSWLRAATSTLRSSGWTCMLPTTPKMTHGGGADFDAAHYMSIGVRRAHDLDQWQVCRLLGDDGSCEGSVVSGKFVWPRIQWRPGSEMGGKSWLAVGDDFATQNSRRRVGDLYCNAGSDH